MSGGMETREKKSVDAAHIETFAGRRVHLIGIAGSGMRALAQMLLDMGAHVSGSDASCDASVEKLKAGGAVVAVGQGEQNIPADCQIVVRSAAIHEENPELIAARNRGLEIVKYSQMLGRLMAQRTGVAISGTHGKSTTTGMVAYALRAAGMNPSFVVGAIVDQLGGPSGVGEGRHFVAEACEFDRSFLNLKPCYAAILNVEEDHLDCYKDLSAIIEAFRAFAALVATEGVLVVNGEDRNALAAVQQARCEVETFGLAEGCTWRGTSVASRGGRYSADVLLNEQLFCRLELPLAGLHNLYNALAATALLHHAGLTGEQIARHLGEYTGARRRMTLRGEVRGVRVVDDYAHHPTEIQATLKALREFHTPRRMICIFQPHQHSRTRFLLKDFARSFGAADEVLVPDIYFVRDSDREKDYISSQDLVAQIRLNGGAASYRKTFREIVEYVTANAAPGDVVVTMGAGNIWEVADEVIRGLGTNR